MDLLSASTTFASSYSFMPVDLIVLVIAAILMTLLTLRFGASLGIALAISLPFALYIYTQLGNLAAVQPYITQYSTGYSGAGVFAAIALIMTVLIYKMTSSVDDVGSRPLAALMTALASVIVIIAVWVQVPALSDVWVFGSTVQFVVRQGYEWLLILGAYLFFAFVRL
jgi:hypothetical protein